MDPTNAFKTEVFRPIASIMLPGMLAIGPWSIFLANAIPEVEKFGANNSILYFALIAGASTITGMLLENIGSSIERGIDQCMDVEYARGATAVWTAYLGLSCVDSYGRKYLGSLVTRMKFINSLIPAVFIFETGIWALHFQLHRWNTNTLVITTIGLFALATWLFRTSIELSEAALFSRFQMLPSGHRLNLDTEADSPSRLKHLAYVLIELRSSRVCDVDLSQKWRWELLKQVLLSLIVSVPPGQKYHQNAARSRDPLGLNWDTENIGD